MTKVTVRTVENIGDNRGDLYKFHEDALAFLGLINDVHFGTIVSGAIRGNHYHKKGKEVMVIVYSDHFEIAWARNADSGISRKKFQGNGAVIVEIEKEITHAIKNTGTLDLIMIVFSDRTFDEIKTDTKRRVLIE